MAAILNFLRKWKNKLASISLTVRDRGISLKFSTPRLLKLSTLANFQKNFFSPKMEAILTSNFHQKCKNTNEAGSCKTTVQLLQNVHGVDITHDNVCSSMLPCFLKYMLKLLLTGHPISSLVLLVINNIF